MSSSIDFATKGFFNSILPLNQTNWADYFSPVIPDGIIAGIGNELQVYANTSGMYVYVKTGECRVRSHRGVLAEEGALDIAAADTTYDRKDLIVVRVTYGSPSTMVIAVKTGTPALTPAAPALTQTAGSVWEIPLAEVTVDANAATIAPEKVTDRRYVYQNSGAAAITFSGISLTVANDWEYRAASEIDSLTINLPANPSPVFICGAPTTGAAQRRHDELPSGKEESAELRRLVGGQFLSSCLPLQRRGDPGGRAA